MPASSVKTSGATGISLRPAAFAALNRRRPATRRYLPSSSGATEIGVMMPRSFTSAMNTSSGSLSLARESKSGITMFVSAIFGASAADLSANLYWMPACSGASALAGAFLAPSAPVAAFFGAGFLVSSVVLVSAVVVMVSVLSR